MGDPNPPGNADEVNLESNLSLYSSAPVLEVRLEDFESFAVDRLRVLKEIYDGMPDGIEFHGKLFDKKPGDQSFSVLVKMWKSDEELGWEDYQSGDKGGPTQGNQSAGGAASLFGQSSASLVSSSSTSNPFASKPSGFSSSGFGSTVSSHAFTYIQSLTPSSPFGSTSSTSSLFSSQNPAFTPSMFSTTGSSTFGLSNSLFGTSLAQGTTNTFGLSPNFSNSQSLPFFQSSTPSMPPSSSPFGQSLGQTTSPFSQNAFNPPSSGFGGNMFASTLSLGQRNIMSDSELEKTRFAKGKQILNEDNGNGSKTTHLMSRRDDRGLKFISQLNKCNLAASVSRENAPSVKVEVKVSLLPLGFMIGGSIVLIGAAGLFLMSQKCDNLISEIKPFREGILLEGRLTRSDIKAILDRWADAGYPPLASLFSLSF